MSKTLRIKSARNSLCGSAKLADLDWRNWYTDRSFGKHYIHVAGPDESWHRVYCRKSILPRIRIKDGELFWIVDEDQAAAAPKGTP